ncbi:MAG: uroporphyrinogen-III synthase [Candidatus Methanospirareceae archaeon]
MRKRVAAFRPESVLERSKEEAERHGFDFFGFPVFELVERQEALKEVKGAFEGGKGDFEGGKGEGVDAVVFTSLNGVKKAFSLCEGKFDLKGRLLDGGVEVWAIGPVTRAELERRGVRVDFMPPEEYSARGLMRLIEERGGVEVGGKKIVFLRSSAGGREILEFLRGRGAFVRDISVYKVAVKDWGEGGEEKERFSALVAYNPDFVVFTSSLTFKTFFGLAERLEEGLRREVLAVLERAKVVAIGDLTAESISEEGVRVDLVAGRSTFEGVLEALKRRF